MEQADHLLTGMVILAVLVALIGCGQAAKSTATSTGQGSSGSQPDNPPASTPSSPSNLSTEQASAAAAFVDSAGVVTHLSYTDTAYYTRFPQILSALESLGVRHIRDGYYPWPASSPIVQAHRQLAQAGIACDYVVPFNATTTAAAIESFSPEVGDMESLEAPNECDIAGDCGTTAAAGMANMLAFLPTIAAAAKNLNVPFYGPSLTQAESFPATGNLAGVISSNNLHIYFAGRNPGTNGWGYTDAKGNDYGSFAWWLEQAAISGPGLPAVVTETGYLSYPQTNTPDTLPESVAASYAPRTLLVAYQNHIQRTFTYELLDEVSSPGYGLLRSDLTPRPAFNAIKNLLAVLNDSSSSFTAGSLAYSIDGGDSALHHLLLEKQDGTFWLVLWLEVPSWDPVAMTAVSVTPETIGVQLTGADKAATLYQLDTSGGVTASTPATSGDTTSLSISDQVTILKIARD